MTKKTIAKFLAMVEPSSRWNEVIGEPCFFLASQVKNVCVPVDLIRQTHSLQKI